MSSGHGCSRAEHGVAQTVQGQLNRSSPSKSMLSSGNHPLGSCCSRVHPSMSNQACSSRNSHRPLPPPPTTVLPSSGSTGSDLRGQHPVTNQPPKSAPPSCLHKERSSSSTNSSSSSLHSAGSVLLEQRRMTRFRDSAQARDRLNIALQAFEMATGTSSSSSMLRS